MKSNNKTKAKPQNDESRNEPIDTARDERAI